MTAADPPSDGGAHPHIEGDDNNVSENVIHGVDLRLKGDRNNIQRNAIFMHPPDDINWQALTDRLQLEFLWHLKLLYIELHPNALIGDDQFAPADFINERLEAVGAIWGVQLSPDGKTLTARFTRLPRGGQAK